ncbi:MAG: helix-turn-helix domain-containing protein, partial [Gammaproteobacteria bacterium]
MSRAANIDTATLGIPSPGSLLQAKREEYGWTIKDVARALRLSERQIEAIEEDDYYILPGKTYVMGYWRSYAQLLQIDIEDSVQVHRADLSGSGRDVHLGDSHHRKFGSDEKSRKRIAILFACLLVVFLSTVWLWQHPEAFIGKWVTIGIDNFSRKQEPESMVPALEEATIPEKNEPSEIATEPQSESVLALPVPNFSEDQETVEINTRGYEIAIADLPLSRPDLVYQVKPEAETEAGERATEPGQESDDVAVQGAASGEQNNASADTQQAASTPTTSASAPEPETASQPATSASGERKIVFKVEQESWIDVRDA